MMRSVPLRQQVGSSIRLRAEGLDHPLTQVVLTPGDGG